MVVLWRTPRPLLASSHRSCWFLLTCESLRGCGHTLPRASSAAVACVVSPVAFGLPVNHRGAAALLCGRLSAPVAGFVSQVVLWLTCEISPGCGPSSTSGALLKYALSL